MSLKEKISFRILLVRNADTKKLLGFSTFYWVRHNMLYNEFDDSSITNYIRQNVKGRIILISGICVLNNEEELLEMLLNETLSVSLNRDYNYAIYSNFLEKQVNDPLSEQLILHGFLNTGLTYNKKSIFMVDMNSTSTLNFDLESILKPPYNTDYRVIDAIKSTRKNLKAAISSLYPGQLLLTYNRDTTYSKLIQKICDLNGVSIHQGEKGLLPHLCAFPLDLF